MPRNLHIAVATAQAIALAVAIALLALSIAWTTRRSRRILKKSLGRDVHWDEESMLGTWMSMPAPDRDAASCLVAGVVTTMWTGNFRVVWFAIAAVVVSEAHVIRRSLS